jgi:hypothetical protein
MLIGIICVIGIVGFYLYKFIFRKENKLFYDWPMEKQKLESDFLGLIENYSNIRYITVSFDNYYVQYMSWPESNELYVEAISNNYLFEKKKIEIHNINKLLNLGFEPPKKIDKDGNSTLNYSKYYLIKEQSDFLLVFEELENIMETVYNIKNETNINLKFS